MVYMARHCLVSKLHRRGHSGILVSLQAMVEAHVGGSQGPCNQRGMCASQSALVSMLGAATWMPMTAEMTEMAGVSTPSPMIMLVDSSTMLSSNARAPALLRRKAPTCTCAGGVKHRAQVSMPLYATPHAGCRAAVPWQGAPQGDELTLSATASGCLGCWGRYLLSVEWRHGRQLLWHGWLTPI